MIEDPVFCESRDHLLSYLEQRSQLRTETRTFRRGETLGLLRKGYMLLVEAP